MANKFDKELLKKHKRSNTMGRSMGGSVFTDRDYSDIFKSKSIKNLFIALFLSPLLLGVIALWIMGLKLLASISLIVILLFSLFSFIFVNASL